MKKITFLLLIFLAFSTIVKAQNFGLGIILGEPTGLSAKVKLTDKTALDFALAYSFVNYGAMHIHGDWIYNFADLSPEVNAYVGIGGRIKFSSGDNNTAFAARVPVGLDWEPKSTPIDVFGELVPMMDLTPSTNFRINAAVGIRYWFGR